MRLLLIAEKDESTRRQIAELFDESEYEVVAPNSVVEVLGGLLRKEAPVVLLGSEFDGIAADSLIPLLKQCNRNLTIILVANEGSLALLRRLRRQGIFYHSLKPVSIEDKDELLTAVRCAFENPPERFAPNKEVVMKAARTLMNTMALLLLTVTPALAVDTTTVYKSGWLVLAFIGLFAVIVLAQTIPAIMMVLGLVKGVAKATKEAGEKETAAVEKTGR